MLSAFLSTELLNLSNECKKLKESSLKDSCEEMMVTLREINKDEQELAFLLSQKQDSLKVFLTCLESKNSKILLIGITCIQKLVAYQAVAPSDLEFILKAFKSDQFTTIDLQLKVLQVLSLCTLYEDVIHGELLSQSLEICYKYSILKNQPILSNTASATFRQMILHAFEKLDKGGEKFEIDALGLFQDLSGPHSCNFLKLSQMSTKTSLELIELVITSTPRLFTKYPELLANVRDKVGPMVAKLVSGTGVEFGVLVRAVRVIKAIIKHLTPLIPVQVELYMTLLIKILQSQSQTKILILEIFKSLFTDLSLPLLLFQTFDASEDFSNIYLLFITTLTTKIIDLTPTLVEEGLTSLSTIKIAITDQLDKEDFPTYPNTYPLYLSTTILLSMIESEYKSIMAKDQSPEIILMNCEVARAGVELVIKAVLDLIKSDLDQEVFEKVLRGLTRLGTVLGLVGLVGNRDSLFFSMTKLITEGLSDRSMGILEGVLEMTNLMGDIADSKLWFGVLETWVLLESGLRKPDEKGRRMTIQPSLSFLEAYGSRFGNESVLLTMFGGIVKKQVEMTSTMSSKSFVEFTRALCRLTHETLARDKEDKGFVLSKLFEVAQGNVRRLVEEDGSVFELICNQLINLAHSPACLPASRLLACTALGDLIVAASQMDEFGNEKIETRLLDGLRALMAMEPRDRDEILLIPEQPNNDLSRLPYLNEVRRLGLEIVNKLLQRSGQNIKSGWLTILEIIYFVVQSQIRRPGMMKNDSSFLEPAVMASPPQTVVSPPGDLRVAIQSSNTAGIDTPTTTTNINTKLLNLVRIGFPSIELICTDFMSSLSPMGLSRCIQTVAAFGSLSDDLNISLTSVGLLWTLCDHILTKRQVLEKVQDENANDEASIHKGSLLDLSMLNGPVSLITMDTLWMYLLRNLSELCSDMRPEVRNSANQTLFRTISMNGSRLNLEAWELLLSHVLFPLLERIQTSAPVESDKNWDDTKIVTLNGVTKSLIEFLPVLVELEDRFDWITFLKYLKITCLESSQEVAMAALKNFKSLVLYGSRDDIPPQVIPKISKLWDVALQVWCDIGKEIVLNSEQNYILAADALPHSIVQWSNDTAPYLLVGTFTQDSLATYFSIIFDLYPLVQSEFNFNSFQSISRNFQVLLLYHSKPPAGATSTRLRVDNVNDLEQMTNCQASFVDWLTNKLVFPFYDEAKSLIVNILSDSILYPFIPFYSSDTTPLYVTSIKKHSFMAFSKKCHELLAETFQKYKENFDLYLSGSFQAVLEAISVPLKYKYDGPSTSARDPVPLWKVSVETLTSILSTAFPTLSKVPAGLSLLILGTDIKKLNNCYQAIVNVLDSFLLSKSACPYISTSENFLKDEFLDLTIISLLEKDALPFFGNPNINKKYCEGLIRILVKLSSQEYNESVPDLCMKGSANASTPKLFSPGTTPGATPLFPAALVTDPDTLDIGPNQVSPQRERQGLICLDTLFKICTESGTETDSDLNVASIALPILLQKCRSVFEKYIAERPISNRLPMPRSRNQEMLVLLKGLLHMNVRVIKKEYNSEIDEKAVKDYLLNSCLSHLFVLYPLICQLLGTISGHAALAQSSGDGQARISDEADMVVLLLACLQKVGTSWQ